MTLPTLHVYDVITVTVQLTNDHFANKGWCMGMHHGGVVTPPLN